MARPDRRTADALRPYEMHRHFQKYPAGSVLIEMGNTKVICAASIEDRVPFFLRGTGEGWIAAEYSLLPSATETRTQREAVRGKQSGRTQEIERLIGRSLRSVVDTKALGERTIMIDCDVIQADGGTRTASVTGAWVALHDALMSWVEAGKIARLPLTGQVAAVSMGEVDGELLLDLDYPEDSAAQVDMNLVGTDAGRIVEVQGTGERASFDRGQLDALLDMGQDAISRLIALQDEVTGFTD